MSSWQVPPQAASESYKLGWLGEHREDGLSWHRSQRGYGDWQKAFEILSGRADMSRAPSYRSSIQTARLKRNLKEVRGAVANIRPIWGYATDNEALKDQANMMNHVTAAIYAEQFLDLSVKRLVDWSMTTCTAFAHVGYRRDMAGTGEGHLFIDAYGQPSVYATQLPSDGDYQKAYAVSLMDEIPIYMAHGLFPKFQDRLYPTSSKFWYASEIRTAARGNLFQRMFGSFLKRGDNVLSDLYVPISKTWVIDLAINETGEDLYLGDWGVDDKGQNRPLTSWSYMVPSLNKVMANGKKADENDARIYPNRRLIISSETCVMYDGPAFDMHGQLPLIPLCLDDWAFDPMGYSLVRDGYELQQSLNELERGTMDKNRAQMDMALAYDINSVSSREAREFDPMQPRGRVGYDGSLTTEPFKSVVPDVVLKIDQTVFQAIQHLEQTMDYQMGINDITALARARGLMGPEDSVDKLMAANGPIVMDITRNVERCLSRIGEQTKFIVPQYYTAQRVFQYVGADKITRLTMDYDPAKLIPSHMPGEDVHDPDTQQPKDSQYSLLQRTKWFCRNLRFSISPHTAHELVQMAHKLGLLQLRKGGIQISSRTIAEAWNIFNFGGPDGATEYDRYYAEQEDVATHAIRIKELVASLQSATGIEPTPAMLRAMEVLTGQNSKEGRPTTGLQSPRMVQKADEGGGGTRTTVSQSGT